MSYRTSSRCVVAVPPSPDEQCMDSRTVNVATDKEGHHQNQSQCAPLSTQDHSSSMSCPLLSLSLAEWTHLRPNQCFERILYMWAIKHPATGYVQGIDHLVSPFFIVFLSSTGLLWFYPSCQSTAH